MLLPGELSQIQGVEIDNCLATVIAEEAIAMIGSLAIKLASNTATRFGLNILATGEGCYVCPEHSSVGLEGFLSLLLFFLRSGLDYFFWVSFYVFLNSTTMNQTLVLGVDLGTKESYFILFLSNPHIQHRPRTHNHEIKSLTLHQLSQPGAPALRVPWKNPHSVETSILVRKDRK